MTIMVAYGKSQNQNVSPARKSCEKEKILYSILLISD